MKETAKNILMSLRDKLKSLPMWFALAALTAYVAKEITGVDIKDELDGLLDVLVPVLIGFGIVNNPNDRKNL
jgi:uncharacterized protein with HEPN domain